PTAPRRRVPSRRGRGGSRSGAAVRRPASTRISAAAGSMPPAGPPSPHRSCFGPGAMHLATEGETRAPFRIAVSDETLEDLRRRLAVVRLPEADGDGGGWDLGTNRRFLAELLEYWRSGFDWRRQEKKLNRFPHFSSTVDGTRLHFIH